MKFAMCNELFDDLEFEPFCQLVAGLGYQGVEIAPFTLGERIDAVTPSRRRELRAAARGAGVEICGLHWLLAHTEGFHLTTDDRATRERTGEYLRQLAQACHDLGGDVMVFGSPGQRSLEDGVPRDRALDHATEVFQSVVPTLSDLGVRLCIEPLAPVETDFVTTCAEGAELVARVAHPSFGLHLDVKAMASEDTPIPDLIREHGATAMHFHANDANLRGPGFGDTDFEPIFAALCESGYDGWVSVEVFDPKPGMAEMAEQSLSYMQRCLPSAG